MSTVALFVKAHDNSQIRRIDRFLKSKLEGLKAEAKIVGTTPRGWVQLAISGEDEKAALRYLDGEIGLCPASLEHVEKFSTLKGYITARNQSKLDLYVDIGVFSPSIVEARIPLQSLQAQLADGRKIALQKLAQLFDLCESMPLAVKILEIDRERNYVEAVLSEKQLSQYKNWIDSLLDRLVVIGSSEQEIELAIERAGLERDVVSIQSLGSFEYAISCKLGTDSAGLIPKIGRILRNATLTTFNPRKILASLEYPAALTFQ